MNRNPLSGAAVCAASVLSVVACSSGSTSLGFTPSNVSLVGIDLSTVGDFVVDNDECTIDTDSNLASCGDGDGGGGGGAGRIRINTRTGSATLATATLSPSTTTACATQGTVQP